MKSIGSMLDSFICSDSYLPFYQVLYSFATGIFFGPFHRSFLWSLVFLSWFEYLFFLATRKRPHLYNFTTRVCAIFAGLMGTILSKKLWQERVAYISFFGTLINFVYSFW